MLGQDRFRKPLVVVEDDDPMNSPAAALVAMIVGSGVIVGATAAVFKLQGWSTKLGRAGQIEESQPWIRKQYDEEQSGPRIW